VTVVCAVRLVIISSP